MTTQRAKKSRRSSIRNRSAAADGAQRRSKDSTLTTPPNKRPEATAFRQLESMVSHSPRVAAQAKQIKQLKDQLRARSTSQGPAHIRHLSQEPGSTRDQTSTNRQVRPTGSRQQPCSTKVAQCAGHAEDLCFVGDWVIKRTDHTEINQYLNGEVPQQAPVFHGPYYSNTALYRALFQLRIPFDIKQRNKLMTMKAGIEPGAKGFMILRSAKAGMGQSGMRDLKMGKHSASGTDQVRHGVTGIKKSWKIFRHDLMDKFSGTRDRGFRDEDRWKTSKLGDNLSELDALLARSSIGALGQINLDLKGIYNWAKQSPVVYVGMSILVVAEENQGQNGKASAIDFEHPIRNNDASFQKHKNGLLLGIKNISDLVIKYIKLKNQ